MMTTTNSTPTDAATLQARLQEALALHQQGQLADACARYERILADHPQQPDALHLLGVAALQSGDATTAAARIGAAIAAYPDNPEFHLNQAIALRALGQLDAALACHDRALALNPTLINAVLGRAVLLKALGRPDDAIAAYGQAIALRPDIPEAHFNLGNLLLELKRFEAADTAYAQALAARPNFAEALINRGNALLQLERAEAALACLDQALALRPDVAEAHVNRGNALASLQRLEEAAAAFDRALALRPDHAEALRNRGKVLYALTRHAAAVDSLQAALALQPADAEAQLYLANALTALHRRDEALAAYDRALALQPDYAEAWYNKGGLLCQLKRMEDAVQCMEAALRLRPGHSFVQGELQNARMFLCDWTDYDASLAQLRAAIARGELALMPFAAQSLIDSPALQLQVARTATATMALPGPLPEAFPPRVPGGKIRLGYFSADFREHPVAQLTAGLFEAHDRAEFEVIGFAFGPPANDVMRQRLEKTFDRLLDVTRLSDREIAQLAREQGIDIAIDLGGYTQNSRPGIFAWRAAPVQVSYIGFLGTMGAPFMDYLIADRTQIPPELREHYSEKIAWLPWYQANDRERRASDRVFTRAELGLPETGAVLACFNNHFKITPAVFDSWMRILTQAPDSVLYLLVDPDAARANLRAAAEARGVSGERVVFAGRLPRADYLARYRVADLFLDTWPCNAGTTASDALCMGVPVLTCQGQAMISRMAASVLTALGMPELITTSPAEYEQRAVALARDPAQLAALHAKVERQLGSAPLFDTPGFTRHLEAAFRAMQARRSSGQAPEDILITP